jgi:hypothetical protein
MIFIGFKYFMMKRITFSLSLVFLILFTSSFMTPVQRYKYSSEEGKMSVTFPGPFESITNSSVYLNKSVKTSTKVSDQIFYVKYSLRSNEFSNPESLAEVSLDAFNNALSGDISQKSVWKINGSKGLMATINTANDLQVQYRTINIGSIEYIVVVASPSASWNQIAANIFFKSFKVVN